jgi:hypothetical protein
MLRVKTRWSGLIGLPGYSIMYFRDFSTGEEWNPDAAEALVAVNKTRTFFDAIKHLIPTGASMQVEASVEEVDTQTGELIDIHGVATPTVVLGTASASASYAAPVGAVINWRTNHVRNGRRLRGRTFIVPMSSTAFESNGTLAAGAVTAITNAGLAMIADTTSPDIGVWGRPTPFLDENNNPTGELNPDGAWAFATTVTVPDLAAVLRSRRD